jgi:group I intron endonuclease
MHVYCITNNLNGKVYVGIHEGELAPYLALNTSRAFGRTRWNDKPFLYRAIRKYGREAFAIESLVKALDREQAGKLEKFFIRTMETRNPEIGYNLAEGGLGGATRFGPHTPEAIEKMRLANKGKPKSLEHRKNLSIAKTGIPAPAVVESNIRRRCENPTLSMLRQRAYRERKKMKAGSNA